MKKPWMSKTLWVNLIVAVVAFFPAMKEVMSPDKVMMLMGVLNMLLRLVTKDKIGLE